MKDLALIVLSVGLAALLARTWGHRRLLHQVREQLEVLAILPSNWDQQRKTLDELATADMARYIRKRTASYPVHRLYFRITAVGFVAAFACGLSWNDGLPGPDLVWTVLRVVALGVLGIVAVTLTVILIVRRKEISAEIDRSLQKN